MTRTLLNLNFNSIKVRLEHYLVSDDKLYIGNFNSIKVRLERNYKTKCYVPPIFQFHKGAIRTGSGAGIGFRLCHFNSIKVRLERA